MWWSRSVRSSHQTDSGASKNIVLPSIFDTSLSSLMMWNLQSSSNDSFEGKSVTFGGKNILWSLLRIFRGSKPTIPCSAPLLLTMFQFYCTWKMRYLNTPNTPRKPWNLLISAVNSPVRRNSSLFTVFYSDLVCTLFTVYINMWHFQFYFYSDYWFILGFMEREICKTISS